MKKNNRYFLGLIPILILLIPLYSQSAQPSLCSYNTYKWNTRLKKAVDFQRIQKPYTELGSAEIDPDTGCSVCEEDQREVSLPGLPAFRMCHVLADQVGNTLSRLMAEGFPIKSVVAYRPGMTRGDVDSAGNRTRFSNHSFGVAVDINSERNGLYDRCLSFGPNCRLIRGGPWQPGVPGTLTADGVVVKAMQELGLHWGGQIQGWQKDFMHFSPTGY